MNVNNPIDNMYQDGIIITAKVNPGLRLVIKHYYQRIYYCAVVDEPDRKHLAYFERELIPPLIDERYKK
jgi:hypothetical protein